MENRWRSFSPSILDLFILTPSTFTDFVSGPQMRSPSNPCVKSNFLSFALSFFSQLIFFCFSSLSISFTPHSCPLTINEFIFLLNKNKRVSFSQTAPKIKVILRTKSRGSGFPHWETWINQRIFKKVFLGYEKTQIWIQSFFNNCTFLCFCLKIL